MAPQYLADAILESVTLREIIYMETEGFTMKHVSDALLSRTSALRILV